MELLINYPGLRAGSDEEFQGDYSLFHSLGVFFFFNLHLCSVCILKQSTPYKFYQMHTFNKKCSLKNNLFLGVNLRTGSEVKKKCSYQHVGKGIALIRHSKGSGTQNV